MNIKPNLSELNELSIESLLKADLSCSELEIDLRDILFVLPYGMLLLIILLKDLNKKNIKVQIILPNSDDVLNYLERMHFFKQAEGLTTFDKDISYLKLNIENPTHSLKEITVITETASIMAIVNEMAEYLINQHGFSREKINKFSEVMIETFQNIPEHSNPAGVYDGIASAQVYNDYFHFALADSGIGMKNSLCINQRYRELNIKDNEAIEGVLFKGWTRHDTPGRGGGFKRVQEIVKQLDGICVVRSGGGVVYLGRTIERKTAEVGYLSGTQIGIRIPKESL